MGRKVVLQAYADALASIERRVERLEEKVSKLSDGVARLTITLLDGRTADVDYEQSNGVRSRHHVDLSDEGWYLIPNFNGQQVIVIAKDVSQMIEAADRFRAVQIEAEMRR